ncbi:hypothetical protein LTS15_002312 [Exophiala xenobiotica]|nr:hypothetical protein LTS15_002312 [Exophiala xenobiotica]
MFLTLEQNVLNIKVQMGKKIAPIRCVFPLTSTDQFGKRVKMVNLDSPDEASAPIHTTLDRGQGVNNAVKDASELFDALTAVYKGQKCLEEVVASSEAEMIPLGVNEIRLVQLVAEKRRDMKNNDPMILKALQKVEY